MWAGGSRQEIGQDVCLSMIRPDGKYAGCEVLPFKSSAIRDLWPFPRNPEIILARVHQTGTYLIETCFKFDSKLENGLSCFSELTYTQWVYCMCQLLNHFVLLWYNFLESFLTYTLKYLIFVNSLPSISPNSCLGLNNFWNTIWCMQNFHWLLLESVKFCQTSRI